MMVLLCRYIRVRSEIIIRLYLINSDLIKDVILEERRAIELEIRQAEQQLRKAKLKKRRLIDQLGVRLRNFCTLPGPAIILVIAIILAVRRSMLRRYYIRHTTES